MEYELAEVLEHLIQAVERQENITNAMNSAREVLDQHYIANK